MSIPIGNSEEPNIYTANHNVPKADPFLEELVANANMVLYSDEGLRAKGWELLRRLAQGHRRARLYLRRSYDVPWRYKQYPLSPE